MQLKLGCFVFTLLLFACLERVRASQDVDGTIVWVDNDKKEKDITVGRPNTNANAELKYWKQGDNGVDNVDDAQARTHDKASDHPAMFVGNEDTPSTVEKPHHKASTDASNTVDAHYVTNGDDADEENVEEDYKTEIEGESHNDGVSLPYSNEANSLENAADETFDSAGLKAAEGDDPTEVESDADDEGKSLVPLDSEQGKNANNIMESLAEDDNNIVTETGDTKATIQKHEKSPSTKAEKAEAQRILNGRLNVKKDHGVGESLSDHYVNEFTGNSPSSYAPDENDISDIVSHFTDNKSDNRHRMGRDELQMHLDDEALKMEVKAIEEEDSNVKNVLQGAEKFANAQKLGRFEGQFEKDLIKDIGKNKMDVEGDDDRNKETSRGREYETASDNKNEQSNRQETDRDKEDDRDDEEHENSEDRNSDSQSHEEKSEDEAGERKHIISSHKKNKHGAPAKIRHKKYRLFGASTGRGEVLADDTDMKVDFDNEAMESEVKAIEAEDAKVSAVLEGNKNSMEFDIPRFYTADGKPTYKSQHLRAARKEQLPGKLSDAMASDVNVKSDTEQTELSPSSNEKMTDEISAMLQETTAVLSQTSAILNESFSTVNKTKSVIDPTLNVTDTATNKTESVNNTTTTAHNLTTTESNATFANQTAEASNKTENVDKNDNKTNESDIHKNFNSSSSDGKEKRKSDEKPAKRDLKKDSGPVLKTSGHHRRSKYHSNQKIKDESEKTRSSKHKHAQSKSKHAKNHNQSKSKYNKKQLDILKLMYYSPVFKHVKGTLHTSHLNVKQKRFITPNVKSFRRFQKQKSRHRKGPTLESEKNGFRQFSDSKKLAEEIDEPGKRRGEVQEGMTGAISYTNRDGNEFMFAVSRATLTWAAASSKCRSFGGELVSIGDKEEQEFIQTNVIPEKGHYWIGFTDQDNEGIWQWTDKTPVRYTNWSNLEPDDGNIKNGQATHNEDCAVINPTMDWSDLPCWNRFQFICKVSPDNGRAISFGGTMSHSDVGNKQSDDLAEGLKNKPSIPTKKPIKEGNPKTRGKTNEMNKAYSGQGPSRGGYLASESPEPATVQPDSVTAKGKEADAAGEAEASIARTAKELAQATANAKTTGTTIEMKKGYSGQGPSRGGYQGSESPETATVEKPVEPNSAMTNGKEADVLGEAEASIARAAKVLSHTAKTRGTPNEMKKGYNGQGPSRGGYQASESPETATVQKPEPNSAMTKGKEADVPGGAEASIARTANALAQATANAGGTKNPVKVQTNANMKPGKYANAGGAGQIGPGVTGLGSIPGVTAASINGNAGLGKIGGVAGGAAPAAVQKGGNGGQSSTNVASQGGGNQGGAANQGGANGGGANVAGGGGNVGNGGGGNNIKPISLGANGGAPGHIATNAGLAQVPNKGSPNGGGGGMPAGGGGMPAGGGGMPAGGGGLPAGGGGMPAGGGGMPAGGGGMPAGGGGMPAGGGGMPAGGGGMPAGGGGMPAGGGGMPAGGGGMPAGGGGMPAGGGGAPQNNNGGGPQGGGGSQGGGGPELSPEQAKVAQQLANLMAPQLEKEYASKFEPEMEMMKTICGKLCADVALALSNDDAEKTGKACGAICARALLKKSPEDAMDLLVGIAKGGGPHPTKPMANTATPAAIPVPVPVAVNNPTQGIAQSLPGGNMQKGDAQPGGSGGASMNGGGNGGGSNGGGTANGGGGNSGGGGGGGNSASMNGGGNGNGFTFGNGKSLNLEELGANLAPKLGLNVKGDGKITATEGKVLKEKVTEAISSLKNEDNIKATTASKSMLPRKRSSHKKIVKAKGFFMLKKTGEKVISPTKKHKVKHAKKHSKKSKKSKNQTGSKRRITMTSKDKQKLINEKKKAFVITL